MTGSMSVDETGDRKMDFTLSILQEKTYVQFVYYQSFKEVASTTRQVGNILRMWLLRENVNGNHRN